MKQESQEFLLSILEEQKNKELLIKDLCPRLPYGVKIRIEYPFLEEEEWHPEILCGLDLERGCIANTSIRLEEFKPYLFPLSSMTDEQRKELEELGLGFYVTCQDIDDDGYMWNEKVFQIIPCTETDDWMNAHHFDIHGLIEKLLAIDCTNLNIY